MTDYTTTQANRTNPSAAWIASIRSKYPVENIIDEMFTRKLQKRKETAGQNMDFTRLQKPLTEFLKAETGQTDLEVLDLQRLSGGASKEQFTFDLVWRGPAGTRETRKLMVRMDPKESIVETHRLRECQVLKAAWGEVPVPEVLWIDPEGEQLGQPALIATFLEGTVQPTQPEEGEKMSGVGMYFNPKLRAALGDQFVKILADIHAIDWRKKDLTTLDVPEPNSKTAVQTALGLWERAWNEDTLCAHPVMERGALWLKENMPVVETPVLVHGDYRSGNFMYADDMKINAIFDWELAYLGDYHDDLAWASLTIFGGPDEEGKLLASSLMSTEEFLEKYEQYSGRQVDPTRLFYYQVLSFYKISVIAAATSIRAAYSRKTHLDAMMNFAGGIGYLGISELNRLLDNAK
ncbi:MAG: phosphotransferase family protein [Gammaproteobacteria bacterium]|nr:MAG: phosphotransferase family protein [Gammaproteobacteria bacterium]RLA49269.1 MAG: phosphotransferase family protein [Gammaproteobacteria bacterium]